MRAKFEAGFAGNPKPEITWWFNGQQMQNSKNVQIKVREDNSVLMIIDCQNDVAGVYECRAVSDMGSDKCRATLTVNSKYFSYGLTVVLCFTKISPIFKQENSNLILLLFFFVCLDIEGVMQIRHC